MVTWWYTRTANAACAAACNPTSCARSSSCATTSSATSKRSVASLARLLALRIGDARDALARLEAAWNRRTDAPRTKPLYVLPMADLPLLLPPLTPAGRQLLERLPDAGP